jgi:hypothetical protein
MRNLSVGSASFSATNILFFFAKAMQKPPYFYELRREREEEWREKGGERMEKGEQLYGYSPFFYHIKTSR